MKMYPDPDMEEEEEERDFTKIADPPLKMGPVPIQPPPSHFVYTLSRLLGCFYYDNRGKLSHLYIGYSVILLAATSIVYSWQSYFQIFQQYQDVNFRDRAIEIVITISMTCGKLIFILISCGMVFWYRKSYPFLMKSVKNFEYSGLNKVLGFLTIATFFLQAFAIGSVDIIPHACYNFVEFQHLLVIAQFITLSNRWTFYLAILKRHVSNFDERMMEGHAKIIYAQEVLNSIYGLPVLLTILTSFVDSVQYLFLFYMSLNKDELDLRKIFPVIYYSLLLFWIVSETKTASLVADGFNQDLFNVMNRNTQLRNNTTLRLYLTRKNTVHFTACGFFNVGYPLITSLIAAAATYLVMLIQFTQ